MVQGFSRSPGTEGPLVEISDEQMHRIRRWAMVIALGGFLFGFDTGVVSGALLFVRSEFGLNAFQQGSVVSILLLGAMVGATIAGRMADYLGRKATLGIEAAVFALGTVVVVASTGYWMLLGGRLILGLAVGGASATVPIYLSEISPPQIRGRNLTLNQLMITVGILVSYLVDLVFSSSGQWRLMFAAGLVPSLLLLVGTKWVPESPAWLIEQGRTRRARSLIASITDEATADRIIERFRAGRQERREQDNKPPKQEWRILLTSRARPALIVGLTLAAVQQLGGINTIIYYAPTIIQQTGLTASSSIFYSVFIGIINVIMTLVAIRLVDRIGRRPLLIFSLAGMLITLVLLGIVFIAGLSPELALVFMVLYIAVYAVGLGPVFWTLIGEIFPGPARAAGSSASTTVNWSTNFVVGLVFLPIAALIGQGLTFWIFAFVCTIALWFVGHYVPETKGRSFDQVESDLKSRFAD